MSDSSFLPAVSAQTILASIVESSDDAIVSKDLNGVVTSWNQGAERLFGYTAEEMIGQPILRLLPEERVAEEAEILSRIRQAEKVDHFETVRRRKDGTLIDVSVTVSPVRNIHGVVVGASKIARDITLRRQTEALKNESDRRKTEFLAMLGHELRNPLAAIRSSVSVIRRTGDAATTTAAEDVLDRQVAHLGRLVDDLLDADRVSRGRLTLRQTPTPLATVLVDAVNAVRARMDACGQTLTVAIPQDPMVVQADATRLAQVFGNLLDNASKFTGADGHIVLEAVREHDVAAVRVRDTGVGLSPEQATEIFDLFTQVDTSLERTINGLGIGLTLVKALVEKHGGSVGVTSAGPGRGTEFVVRLPLSADAPAPMTETPSSIAPVSEPLHILIVDDNKDAAEMLSMVLTLSGHVVEVVHDGEAAVAAAAARPVDVILLDIGLPKLNGYEAARQIRAQPRDHKLVIVALTGWGQDADRRRSAEAGFDAHWVKPVDEQQLERFLADLAVDPARRRPKMEGGTHGEIRKEGTDQGRARDARTQGGHAAQRRLRQKSDEP